MGSDPVKKSVAAAPCQGEEEGSGEREVSGRNTSGAYTDRLLSPTSSTGKWPVQPGHSVATRGANIRPPRAPFHKAEQYGDRQLDTAPSQPCAVCGLETHGTTTSMPPRLGQKHPPAGVLIRYLSNDCGRLYPPPALLSPCRVHHETNARRTPRHAAP